jgi:hypothetical protein
MDKENVKRGFGKVLNSHGYGFHYSVLKVAEAMSKLNESNWLFEAAEFPVQVQGAGTRIDFVLKLSYSPPVYLLAECKRANPRLSNWCFARAPYVRRNRTDEPFFVECVRRDTNEVIDSFAWEGMALPDAYHIALEVRSSEKGDPCGSGRGAIENAATQICRGLNGMVEFIAENGQILSNNTMVYFLPVIFTTAQVWASDVDLGTADIEGGSVDFEHTDLEEKPWVFYQYHLSPGIKHLHSPAERPATIGKLMDLEYVRTITVVTASKIQSFFRWSSSHTHSYLFP